LTATNAVLSFQKGTYGCGRTTGQCFAGFGNANRRVMAKREEIVYTCDRCKTELGGPRAINLVTSLSESLAWSRLHVNIKLMSGVHNDSSFEPADLCRECAIALLSDAVNRVKKGERASAGTESSDQLGWG
jgi:hypothetical protein